MGLRSLGKNFVNMTNPINSPKMEYWLRITRLWLTLTGNKNYFVAIESICLSTSIFHFVPFLTSWSLIHANQERLIINSWKAEKLRTFRKKYDEYAMARPDSSTRKHFICYNRFYIAKHTHSIHVKINCKNVIPEVSTLI